MTNLRSIGRLGNLTHITVTSFLTTCITGGGGATADVSVSFHIKRKQCIDSKRKMIGNNVIYDQRKVLENVPLPQMLLKPVKSNCWDDVLSQICDQIPNVQNCLRSEEDTEKFYFMNLPKYGKNWKNQKFISYHFSTLSTNKPLYFNNLISIQNLHESHLRLRCVILLHDEKRKRECLQTKDSVDLNTSELKRRHKRRTWQSKHSYNALLYL